jgi:hypothetical protein
VNARPVQLFFRIALIFVCSELDGATEAKIYPLKFSDVDGNQLSTSDGHITVLTFVTSGDADKAQVLGDRIPDFCLGDAAHYRMITVVEATNHSAPIRLAYQSIARHRLDAAAKRLQARYDSHKIARSARQDVFAVVDFGGAIASNFPSTGSSSDFRVVVLGPHGELRQQWTEMPTTEQLAAALK